MSTATLMTNGVNVGQLVGTINLIKESPALAQFRFRAHTEWVNGGHSRTQIQGFYGAGGEDTSRASPLVSAAVDAGVDEGITRDFDGNSRPYVSGYDIGYDEEFQSTAQIFLPLMGK